MKNTFQAYQTIHFFHHCYINYNYNIMWLLFKLFTIVKLFIIYCVVFEAYSQ